MSLIQKAVTFVKKKWATGDTVLPDDLNRYEDSIDNLCKSKLNIADIVNGLDSNDPSKVLAATQGKALANRDIELSNQIKVLQGDVTGLSTSKANKANTIETGIYTEPMTVLEWAKLHPNSVATLTGNLTDTLHYGWYGTILCSMSDVNCLVTIVWNNDSVPIFRNAKPDFSGWLNQEWKEYATSDKVRSFDRTLSVGDFNLLIDPNKVYQLDSNYMQLINTPTGTHHSDMSLWEVEVSISAGIVQTATCTNNARKYTRMNYVWGNDTTWSEWKEVATTEKIDISFPFTSDYTTWIHYRKSLISKNSCNDGLITVYVAKKDGTNFTANLQVIIGNLVTGFKQIMPANGELLTETEVVGTILDASGNRLGIALCSTFQQGIYVLPLASCNVIAFTMPYRIGD